jgi:hypothetical protein
MKNRFALAMILYAILAIGAAFLLQGNIRLAVLILLGGLSVKTCIARAARW